MLKKKLQLNPVTTRPGIAKYQLLQILSAPLDCQYFNDVKEIAYNEQLKTPLSDIAKFYLNLHTFTARAGRNVIAEKQKFVKRRDGYLPFLEYGVGHLCGKFHSHILCAIIGWSF